MIQQYMTFVEDNFYTIVFPVFVTVVALILAAFHHKDQLKYKMRKNYKYGILPYQDFINHNAVPTQIIRVFENHHEFDAYEGVRAEKILDAGAINSKLSFILFEL